MAGQNIADVVTAANELLSNAGITPAHVPGRILFPILEQSSIEVDDELRAKWVTLLANAPPITAY